MIYTCDNQRHLVCYPYSIKNLHEMANKFYIKRCWFHKDHYDIPIYKIIEISEKCFIVSSKDIVKIIKKEKEFTLLEKAEAYAITSHGIINHFYDDKPYRYHLQKTVDIAMKFIHLIPEFERDNVIGGCWNHDNIEDTRQNWNNIKNFLNEKIANYSFFLANNRGKDRYERANENYYICIKNYEYALFIKLCDRIANVIYSKNLGSSMFKKYKNDEDFYENLYDGRYIEMWNNLTKLLQE